MKFDIQQTTQTDHEAILEIHRQAFGREAEAQLVDLLVKANKGVISLVAVTAEQLVGHILFSPVTLENEIEIVDIRLLGLGPIAVFPQFQGLGAGSQLIQAGIQKCRELAFAGMVVLGSPTYYGRFGFVTASQFGFGNEYGVDAAFMAQPLFADAFLHKSGLIKYAPEFAQTGS